MLRGTLSYFKFQAPLAALGPSSASNPACFGFLKYRSV